MDAIERQALFRRGAEAFFDGASFLVGVSHPTALVLLRLAASATTLLLARGRARLDAVLNVPIDVVNTGYDLPEPAQVLRAFSAQAPQWPGVEVAFAPEVARGDWEALQAIHRVLFTLMELDQPLLRAVFAEEIAAQSWRAVVDQWPAATAAFHALTVDARTRGAFERFARLFTGPGAAHDDAQARARIAAHWADLKAAALEVFR